MFFLDCFHHRCLRIIFSLLRESNPFQNALCCYLSSSAGINSNTDRFPEKSLGWQEDMARLPTASWHWQQREKHQDTFTLSQTEGESWYKPMAISWLCDWLEVLSTCPGLNCLIVPSIKRQKEDPPFKQSEWAECSVLVPVLPWREAETWNTR